VYDLNTYRDGSLPAIQQEIHLSDLQILRCSYWALRSWNHTSLCSPYWRLYWNRQPGATVVWRNQDHPLQPDRLVLIAPNTPFTSRLGEGSGLDHQTNIMVGLPYRQERIPPDAGLVCHLFVHFTLGVPYDTISPRITEVLVTQDALGLVNTVTRALSAHRRLFDHRQSFALHALVLFALQSIPDTDWPERQIDPRVLRVLSYIDQHLHRHLRNEDFGRVARMSTNACTRLFKQKTGITPLGYLNQRRIEQASILLHHTDHSIEEIAGRCGFTDRFYFTRVFQKQFGVGPATYRKHRVL
jgi:AraC-like DNA-binding protein